MRPPLSVAFAFAIVVISSPVAVAQWGGEWKLDEKSGTAASDSSGSANHGTLKNFVTTPSPWVAGKFGNALLFDGVDDYVDIGIKKGLLAYDGKGSPYSIVFWVKAPAQHDKRCYAEGYSKAATGYGAINYGKYTLDRAAIGVVQGVAISGTKLELSNAVLAQLGK